jgi:hypothetical protein
MSTPFGTFLHSVGQLFATFVDSAKRGQVLPYYPAARLPGGRWLSPCSAINGGPGLGNLGMQWRLTFAYRYAGLCAVQLLLSAGRFGRGELWVDEKNCFAFVGEMRRGEEGFLLMREYLDEVMVLGPFRGGLMSAGNCLTYNREKVRVLLATLVGQHDLGDAEKISIADGNVDDVIQLIHTLILKSVEGSDNWSLPWL